MQSINRFNAEIKIAENLGRVCAYICSEVANYSAVYSEPNVVSIDDWDREYGDKNIVDPLLSAHRLAKFYTISCGDALMSASVLLGSNSPCYIGISASARSAVEHAAKVAFLTSLDIDAEERVLRACGIFQDGMNDYRSSGSSLDGGENIIEAWVRWKNGFKGSGKGKGKQKLNTTDMISRLFNEKDVYKRLSRAAHGNAAWLTAIAIQEQKNTNFAQYITLSNYCLALKASLFAAKGLCGLWDLDCDSVWEMVNSNNGAESSIESFESFYSVALDFVEYISSKEACVVVDCSVDRQPKR